MKRLRLTAILCLSMVPLIALHAGDRYWPQWRGPDSTGAAPDSNPPVEWSEDSNIKWKIDLPGLGHATPAIWGDRLYVLSAAPGDSGLDFIVSALNRKDGSEVWSRTAAKSSPKEGGHQTNTQASGSAVTDGELLYAHFGSYGLYVYDLDGNPQWDKDLGDMSTRNGFGEGASPSVYGEHIVVLWDHEGDSFIVTLNKRTGNEVWRKPRDERTTWSTPLILEHSGKTQVIVNATNRVVSYNITNGDIIWQCSGMTANAIPSPVAAGNRVYVMSGFRGSALFAIDLDKAKGDITGSDAIVWNHGRDTPYVPSPLLYDDTLYFLKGNNGQLSAFNATTGESYYGPERLEGIRTVYASPVGASGRVYIVDREGSALVVEHGPEFKTLAVNTLDDGFSASPAIVDDEIYLRGERHLYCIAAQ